MNSKTKEIVINITSKLTNYAAHQYRVQSTEYRDPGLKSSQYVVEVSHGNIFMTALDLTIVTMI